MTKKQTRAGHARHARSDEIETARARSAAAAKSPELVPLERSDINAAAKAAASLAIVSVRHLELDGTTTNRAFTKLPREVKADLFFTRPTVETKDALVAIVTQFTFRLRASGGDETEPVAAVRLTTELLYSRKPDSNLSNDDLAAFARVNAPFNAWPYWRELTQSTLTRLGLPALPLPLFHVEDVPKMMREP